MEIFSRHSGFGLTGSVDKIMHGMESMHVHFCGLIKYSSDVPGQPLDIYPFKLMPQEDGADTGTRFGAQYGQNLLAAK